MPKSDLPEWPDGRPILFSMGDPSGIGPEVLLKALGMLLTEAPATPIIFGDSEYLKRLAEDLGLEFPFSRVQIEEVGSVPYPPDWGEISSDSARLAFDSLQSAVLCGKTDSHPLLVTPPVNKKALKRVGFDYPGQTEFVSSHFPGSDGAMAFFSEPLNLILATVHLPLRELFDRLSPELVTGRCRLLAEALRRLGAECPSIAVAGVNPHASEEGLFGDEEARILYPAIERLQEEEGAEVTGPYPPDTVFRRAAAGEFDGVLALYHDQGLIPLKMIAFESAVNATLGLPMIRTSPDHGTAFDIAGRGGADPRSMAAAIRVGMRLALGAFAAIG